MTDSDVVSQAEGLSHRVLYEALATCARLPDVRREVIANHDDNRWWPLAVQDWRLRMVIAGWSTRVSYRMIETFQRVVSDANDIGYDRVCALRDEDLRALIGSLGLYTARKRYLYSLANFIHSLEANHTSLSSLSNDHLIALLAREVMGAGYKVAQCAVLYAKGYHCGIFPVDSGIKDMLGPCLGLALPRGAMAHKVMRLHIEGLLKSAPQEYYDLAIKTGYQDLCMPEQQAPVWWAHLVLVYFKRLYCNQRNPACCPLRVGSGMGLRLGCVCVSSLDKGIQ